MCSHMHPVYSSSWGFMLGDYGLSEWASLKKLLQDMQIYLMLNKQTVYQKWVSIVITALCFQISSPSFCPSKLTSAGPAWPVMCSPLQAAASAGIWQMSHLSLLSLHSVPISSLAWFLYQIFARVSKTATLANQSSENHFFLFCRTGRVCCRETLELGWGIKPEARSSVTFM